MIINKHRMLMISITATILFFTILALAASQQRSRPHLPYPVSAPPYSSAVDCEHLDYQPLAHVRKGCLQERYHITDPGRYGLPGEYKGNIWYRVNDDAVYMTCLSFEATCRVHSILRGFYIR